MTIWDDRILEYICNEGGASVGNLAESELIRVSNAHISRRCKKIADHGLLTPLGNGVYVITDEGKAYLNQEYDAEAGAYNKRAEDDPNAGDTAPSNG